MYVCMYVCMYASILIHATTANAIDQLFSQNEPRPTLRGDNKTVQLGCVNPFITGGHS